MENLKKIMSVVALFMATSGVTALLSSLLDKPTGKSYTERFVTFLLGFAIAFGVGSVILRKKRKL